jgi:hypothetical protein
MLSLNTIWTHGRLYKLHYLLASYVVIHLVFTQYCKPMSQTDSQRLYACMIYIIISSIVLYVGGFSLFYKLKNHLSLEPVRYNILLYMIIAGGLILRMTWWSTPLTASEDAWRYLWDGALQWQDASTYIFPPKHHALDIYTTHDSFLAHIRSQIGHNHVATIYPPAAQLIFKLAYGVHPSLLSLRVLLVLSDLLLMVGLVALLKHFQYSPFWIIFYALHPLVIFEVGHGTHLDTWGSCAMIWGFYLYKKNRYFFSAVCMSLGGWIKLIPWIPMSFIGIKLFRKRLTLGKAFYYYIIGFSLVSALCCLPFIQEIPYVNQDHGLYAYGTRWRFNDGLFFVCYTIIKSFLKFGKELICYLIDLSGGAGDIEFSRIHEYALGFTKGGGILGFIWFCKCLINKRHNIIHASLYAIIVLLLISPVVFSWYLTWIIALMPLALASLEDSVNSSRVLIRKIMIPNIALIGLWICLWTTLIPFSYLPRIHYLAGKGWHIESWWITLEYTLLWLTFLLIKRYNSFHSHTHLI